MKWPFGMPGSSGKSSGKKNLDFGGRNRYIAWVDDKLEDKLKLRATRRHSLCGHKYLESKIESVWDADLFNSNFSKLNLYFANTALKLRRLEFFSLVDFVYTALLHFAWSIPFFSSGKSRL